MIEFFHTKNYNAFDPLFNIPWPIKKNVIISKKDKKTKFIKAS